MSQVTVFVPFKDSNGEQNAAVQIQSRKKANGQLDAENCRLLFDLKMEKIGQTLVDVAVMNKIVSIDIRSDYKPLAATIQQLRPLIQSGLHDIGYQCSSLKSTPLTPPPMEKAARPLPQTPAPSVKPLGLQQTTTMPYKGIDFKA
jgi:hypothetical protein